MNTNALKKFAREARVKLLDIVSKKLEYVLTQDTAELRGKKEQISKLKQEILKTNKQHVIDRVAYIWFNRIMALRFMDANGYTNPKVVTPLTGSSIPEILQEAKAGHINENLSLDRQRLNDLLDGRIAANDAQTEAYKILLIAACNAWNPVMPAIFERIADYTELLMPDDLLSEFSIVTIIREGMPDEDCKQEELIGWLYQFYIADKKDEVFAGLAKNQKITPENIPAATQLFTPRWIVRYMVENTLGKIWLTLKPESRLREFMPYYIEAPEGNEPAPIPDGINSVTDITFLDPCMGSGHVLVYAFELFTRIYEEEGYNTNEIPGLIFKHNLFGLDIDERAAQLAVFALMMKARAYYSRFLRKAVLPNVIALENVAPETIEQAVNIPLAVSGKLIYNHKDLSLYNLTQADNFGSLIQIDEEELKAIEIQKGSLWQDKEITLHKQADYLSRRYHCVVTNPPYMGGKGLNGELKSFLSNWYQIGKADTFAAFILRCQDLLKNQGISGMVTMESWMFLSSFEELRKQILGTTSILSLSHFGWHIMRIAFGTCSFILQNKHPIENDKGVYSFLVIDNIDREKDMPIEFPVKSNGRFNEVRQKDFVKIPGSPIGYWASDSLWNIFVKSKKLINISRPCQGMATTNNSLFVREWYEVSINKSNYCAKSIQDSIDSDKKWFPYNKGGGYRKWWGNHENLVNFENSGQTICDYIDSTPGVKVKSNGRVINKERYFLPCISWSKISSGNIAMRYYPEGFTFDVAGCSIFGEKKFLLRLLAFVNSTLAMKIFKIYSPTLNYEVGQVNNLPIHKNLEQSNVNLENMVEELINIYRDDWNEHEISWEFTKFPLTFTASFSLQFLTHNFIQHKTCVYESVYKLENEVNELIYGIYQTRLVMDDAITADKISLSRRYYDYENKTAHSANLQLDVISFAIGCIFGRFSCDLPGLIIANQGEQLEDYLIKIPKPRFFPDEDNIIPVLDGEYFTDDIVGRFYEFIKIAFGSEHYEENIKFIEDAIGKDIRKYFVKDFYNDHIKRYKKHPIYWMFSSPKGSFKALIYMHRYRPDTVSKILNDYLRVFIGKLEANKQSATSTKLSEHASNREKLLADKKITEIEAMIKDCKDYERTLFEVAAKKIEIDLDDGVKVNYMKFKDVLVPIKGLEKNDE